MDVEARRKYCGLLMFPPTSRNNDITMNNMSMRDVDPSSSTYESSRIMMSDHQFVMQDGFGDFTASSRALAAGAAAGGDLINQENLDTSNVIDGDTSNSKSQPAKRTPRPPNAFILYRRAKQPAIIASQRNLTNAEVSRTISDMWRKEPEEIRLEWERYADRKKLEHMQTYPNYVYRPNKNKSKVDKRRQQRKQSTKESTTNSANNNNNNNNNNNLVENKPTNPGPVRRRSTKNVNSKPPTKLDLPLSMNGMAGFNQQSSNNNNSNTYATILPSPEVPLLSAHFTENPGEFINSNPITPITPLTPPENDHDYKLLHELTYQPQQQQQQQHHHHQGNAQHFSFQPIPLTHYNASNQTVEQLDFCFVPDVEQQQQQMIAEMMLHHEQHHHITPTATVPSSNPTSTVQYYANNGSFTEMLGFEFPFLGGSVSHNGNGLDTSGQYHLQ